MILWTALLVGAAWPDDVRAETSPTVSASMRDTLDVWQNAQGGLRKGRVLLNKLQLSATVAGDQFGFIGWSIHGQVFRTDGRSLSAKLGDIQTVDSIDARPVTRLFESWIEKKFGNDDRSFAVRAGLIDFNSDFDSIQTASLFANSSHGIGADIARSGRNGPSIYPVSAAGVRISWLPSKTWTFRVAAFDGVAGDPNRPKAFVHVRLAPNDGALTVAQVDYHLSDKARIEAGVWRYSLAVPDLNMSLGKQGHDQGAYASIDSPIPGSGKWSAWLRLGFASGHVQAVNGYVGAGIVGKGLVQGRPDDRLGLALARAHISDTAVLASRISHAESSIEASYQIKIHDSISAQPDVQYILHPAGASGTRDALVFGLRFVLSSGFPKKAPATDPTDPTVPPEAPQPAEARTGQ